VKTKIEWQYLVIVGVVIALAIMGWRRAEISDINVLFSLGGAILTLTVLTAFPVEIGKMSLSNFFMQTALLNITLGIGAIKGVPPPAFTPPPPHVVLVATATEEIFRVGSYQMIMEAYEMPKFATLVSGIVFAAMHMYWQPTQWVFAIAGGALFSLMLMTFQSQTACIASHFVYDMLAFQYIAVLPYFALSALTLILSQIPIIKEAKI
jgi:membrane protease YdiL (CAAX protease family)